MKCEANNGEQVEMKAEHDASRDAEGLVSNPSRLEGWF